MGSMKGILTVQLVYGILKDTCYVRDIYIIVDLTTCFVLYILLKDLLYTCYLMICFIHLTWGFVAFTPWIDLLYKDSLSSRLVI